MCSWSGTHHGDRSSRRIVLTDSSDLGRTWSPKRALTQPTRETPAFWNCPRIAHLQDGRLESVVDKLFAQNRCESPEQCHNYLFFSDDEGKSWSEPVETPARGIVPDKLLELDDGRWILSCHYSDRAFGYLVQRLWYTDDQGRSWNGPITVEDMLIVFLRENSGRGWDCYKTISADAGETWGEVIPFTLPGCHRPTAGVLRDIYSQLYCR